MRRTTAAAAAAALGLAALGGVGVGSALMTTAVAESSTDTSESPSTTETPAPDDSTDEDGDDAARLADRTTRITEALAGLVTDGTITQEQADAVAQTLASSAGLRGGPGGHGGGHGFGGFGGFGVLQDGLTTASTTLGITEDELRTQLEAGDTLGEIADNAGVERAALVDALVAFAQEQVAERVTAGDLTQAQADDITADLQERITESLDRSIMDGGRGFGHGGFGRGMDDDADD